MTGPVHPNQPTMKAQICAVLEEAVPALKHTRDEFFIIGASALILAGIEIETTPDIDILLTTRDAQYLQREWKDKRQDNFIPDGQALFRSAFSRYHFGAMDLELMGDLEVYVGGAWQPVIVYEYTTITIAGFPFRILTLREQARILKLFGREKDLKKIALLDQHRAG